MKRIGNDTKKELLGILRKRHGHATKKEKTKILDEFVAISGFHRKHGIRLMIGKRNSRGSLSPACRKIYDEAVKEALTMVWEAADRICGKRLKEILPFLLESMERNGHLKLDPNVRERLLCVSASTIDRLLATRREKAKGKRKRKKPTKPSKKVPIRTFADWSEPEPGYFEIDFVEHGGGNVAGSYIYTLAATDIASGWIECIPLLAREQSLVVEGLKVLGHQCPVPILGIDSDNDRAFINETLVDYCNENCIEFTRSRAYRKNDQAWIEQKNGAVVRRFVGYKRYSGVIEGQILAQLFQAIRLYVNYFQPSFKIRKKIRTGSKVKKVYYKPATPCQRLLEHPNVSYSVKEKLRSSREHLDPIKLLHCIRESQRALVAASCLGEEKLKPGSISLDEFLSHLPKLWRDGEVRPTHRQKMEENALGERERIPSRVCGLIFLDGCAKNPM